MAKRKKQKAKAAKAAPPKQQKKTQPADWERFIERHPFLSAVIIFAALVIIFFGIIRPALFAFDMMVYGTDTMAAAPFFRGFYADFWREHGEMPLWEPYIHGGMPFVDAMHGDIFYPAAILQVIFPVTYALGLKLILHVFLAGVFMYLFLREWGLSWRSSVFGGILYIFTPALVSLMYPGHDGKMYVTALTPLAFMFLHRGVVTRQFASFFVFGLVYTLLVLTAHVQMAYYASWGLGLYFLYMLWDQHRYNPRKIAKPILAFALAVVLALGASAIQWLSPYFYLQNHSQRIQHTEERGFEWATSWSMNAAEVGQLLVPEFPGNNVNDPNARSGAANTYWGANYFKLNSEAVGVFALFFAILALVRFRTRQAVFLGVLSLFALVYATGSSTPLFTLSYYLVPMVKNFRAPSMINFLYAFGLVVLAAWAVHKLESNKINDRSRSRTLRAALIIAAVYSGITVLISLGGEGFFRGWAGLFQGDVDAQTAQAITANTPRVIAALWISTVLLWGAVGLIWLRFTRSLSTTAVVAGLALLAIIDLWRVDARYVYTVDPDNYYRRSALIDRLQQIQEESGPTRTFILPGTVPDNYLAMYGLGEVSLSAMHGNHLLSYDNFTGRHERPQNLVYQHVLDLLNVGYVLSPMPAEQLIQQAEQARNPELLLIARMIAGWGASREAVGGFHLYENPSAVSRATLYFGYQVEPDHERVLKRVKDPKFPHRRILLLEKEIPQLPPTDNPESLPPCIPMQIVENSINEMEVAVDVPRDAMLFLAENYYPAWRAEGDGEPLEIYRADYTFRAIFVEAGTSRIHLYFENPKFTLATWLSGGCILLLVAGLGVTSFVSRRRSPESHTIEQKPPEE